MSQLCIVMQSSVQQAQQSSRALRFCRQAIADGHQLTCVFFYRQSVDHAATDLANSEQQLQQQWQQFSQRHAIPLVVCHTVAERQGLTQFAPYFDDTGLTALVSAMAKSDRTLQF